jgi:hypothetical protein
MAAASLPDGRAGERFLEDLLGAGALGKDAQVRLATSACTDRCNVVARIFDVYVADIAHESKVGYPPWSAATERQIRSDAWAVRTGGAQGAHWHFFPSAISNTVGADPRVLDLLDELRIPYTIHLPR